MKKIFILTLVLALLAVTVVPVFAAGNSPTGNGGGSGKGSGGGGGGGGGRGPFALAGTIASLDPTTRTVTVTVACGNKLVKPFIGQNLTLQTTADKRFLLRNPDGFATQITFEDLVVGQKISANGTLTNNVWTAQRITVGADLNCQP